MREFKEGEKVVDGFGLIGEVSRIFTNDDCRYPIYVDYGRSSECYSRDGKISTSRPNSPFNIKHHEEPEE